MSTFEIGKKYVELCQAHQNHIAIETLFSPDVVSVEAAAMPGSPAEVRGVAAVLAKGKQWMADTRCTRPSSKGHGPTAIASSCASVTT